MTRAMRAHAPAPGGMQWLRWALVRDGRIVREALVAPDGALRADELSAEGGPIARVRDGAWRLRIEPAWRGRLGDRVLSGIEGELALPPGARARMFTARGTLILHLVERPPARPRPQLPASVRGSLLERADWLFTAFVTVSLFLHFAFVVLVLEADFPVEAELVPARYVEPIFAEARPPEAPPEVDVPESTADASEDAAPSAEDANAPATPTARPRHAHRGEPSVDHEAIAREMHAAHLMLGAALSQGAMRDLVQGGAPTQRQVDLMEAVTGPMVATTEDDRVRERHGSTMDTERTLAQLRRGLRANARDTGPLAEGEPLREQVVTIVRPSLPDVEIDTAGPFDSRQLVTRLRARMSAIQRCYEHELTRSNPDLEGRVTVVLRVMPVGSMSDVRAAENTTGSDALAACTVRSLQTVRVTPGPEQPVEVRYPIVFTRQR